MPPEMITSVAPTAMIAKKLASVAVWIRVCELRKLLISTPERGSTCDPAKIVRIAPSRRMTSTRPSCEDASARRSTAGRIAGTSEPAVPLVPVVPVVPVVPI
jgi:hypothetical protein